MLEKIKLQYQAYKILRTKNITLFPKKFLFYLLIKSQYEKLSLHDGKFVISSDLPPFPSGAFDRLIEALHSTREQEVIPIYASFSITNKCVYNCWHCYINSLKEEDMPTEDAIKILYKLQELGTSVIAFTGGEPLLRKDICEIISKIDADKSSVVLFTTGYRLTKEKAEDLKQAGLFGVIIGLEHTNKKMQDKLRNYDDSYERALEGIKNAKNSGLYVGISTVATKERIKTGDIWDFIKFAGKKGADEVLILEPIPVGKIMNKDEVILTNKERKQLVNIQKKVNKKKRYPRVLSYPYRESKQLIGCCGGYQYIHVTASGNICPCSFTPLSFGNVKNEEMSVIWRRMNTVFNTPEADCFMVKNYKYISQHLEDGFINPEKSVELCSSCRNHNVPLFYKKLGVK
ncbi:MAG: radical SAM protein [Thermoplasmata archaeon]|nr:radical SAM protein [Thermoplasmata archaeon]